MKAMINTFLLILAFALLTAAVRAFPAEDAKYKLSEVQRARLELRKTDYFQAQQALSIAQANLNDRITAFNTEIKAVEKENSWPDTLQFDPNALEFKDAPAKPTAPAPQAPPTPTPTLKTPAPPGKPAK
jgi:hypothetical protein